MTEIDEAVVFTTPFSRANRFLYSETVAPDPPPPPDIDLQTAIQCKVIITDTFF